MSITDSERQQMDYDRAQGEELRRLEALVQERDREAERLRLALQDAERRVRALEQAAIHHLNEGADVSAMALQDVVLERPLPTTCVGARVTAESPVFLTPTSREEYTGPESRRPSFPPLSPGPTSTLDIDKALDRAGIAHTKGLGDPGPAAHLAGEDRGLREQRSPCSKGCAMPSGHEGACADASGRVMLVRRRCVHGVPYGGEACAECDL